MKVTIVTLFDHHQVEHYVGCVAGEVADEDRAKLATAYDALLEEPEDDDDFEGRTLDFAEVEMADKPTELKSLLNIDGEWPTVHVMPVVPV